MAKNDISKFNWQELFNNETGKTSMSSFIGGLLGVVGAICFAFGVFTKSVPIMDSSIFVIGASAGLLGVRKFMNNKEIKDTTEDTPNV